MCLWGLEAGCALGSLWGGKVTGELEEPQSQASPCGLW